MIDGTFWNRNLVLLIHGSLQPSDRHFFLLTLPHSRFFVERGSPPPLPQVISLFLDYLIFFSQAGEQKTMRLFQQDL